MSQIVFDNIGFSLQKMGGLSVVWGTLMNAIQDSNISYECLEYKDGKQNLIRRDISNLNVKFKDVLFLQIERYLSVTFKQKTPFIFHSSHYRLCKNPNCINITTVHDFTYERYRKGLPRLIHSWQKFNAIRNANVVVCISESTKKDILHYLPDVPEEKIKVIYNGVSDAFHQVDTHTFDYLGKYIVFVGSRQPYKRFDYVVKCLANTNYKLAIVGGKLTDDEILFLNNNLGPENYAYLGFLSTEQLNELYNQAYCLAYPSLYEGFGIPVLEAQRAGCPVIAYNASSIPEIIGETPLLLDSLSEDEFLLKLDYLGSKNNRFDIIQMGLENSHRFSWNKMSIEYISLYKSLIEQYSIK